jgi:hypothetical protein
VLEQWLATTLPGVEELRIDDLSKPATSGVANETLLRRALVRPRGHGVGAHQVDAVRPLLEVRHLRAHRFRGARRPATAAARHGSRSLSTGAPAHGRTM